MYCKLGGGGKILTNSSPVARLSDMLKHDDEERGAGGEGTDYLDTGTTKLVNPAVIAITCRVLFIYFSQDS